MKDLRRYTKNARKKRVLKKERVDLRPDNSTNSNWKVCVNKTPCKRHCGSPADDIYHSFRSVLRTWEGFIDWTDNFIQRHLMITYDQRKPTVEYVLSIVFPVNWKTRLTWDSKFTGPVQRIIKMASLSRPWRTLHFFYGRCNQNRALRGERRQPPQI